MIRSRAISSMVLTCTANRSFVAVKALYSSTMGVNKSNCCWFARKLFLSPFVFNKRVAYMNTIPITTSNTPAT